MNGKLLSLALLAIILVGCVSAGSKNTFLENELKEVFEKYLTIRYKANLTLDTTELSNVATGEALKNSLASIEVAKENYAKSTSRSSYEFEVVWVKILASGTDWAVIEAKENYLPFTEDVQNGQRTYGGRTEFYWNVQRYLLIREDNAWKVDRILEFVNWSG